MYVLLAQRRGISHSAGYWVVRDAQAMYVYDRLSRPCMVMLKTAKRPLKRAGKMTKDELSRGTPAHEVRLGQGMMGFFSSFFSHFIVKTKK